MFTIFIKIHNENTKLIVELKYRKSVWFDEDRLMNIVKAADRLCAIYLEQKKMTFTENNLEDKVLPT